jgi:chromosome segregation ATPase
MSDGGFMGSMFGAYMVSSEIAHQGAMNRHQINRLHNQAAEVAVLRRRDAWLVQQHNQLAADYNKLNAWATGLAERYDQQARDLARLRKENEDLRSRLRDVSTELAVMVELDRELHPEAHRFDHLLGF